MKRRIYSVLAATALAGGTIFAGAQLAFASGGIHCNYGGHATDLGEVCVIPQSNGYNASYYNNTRQAKYVDFNLQPRGHTWIGDKGAFTVAPGKTRTYVFAVGNLGCAEVILYDQTGVLPPEHSGYSC